MNAEAGNILDLKRIMLSALFVMPTIVGGYQPKLVHAIRSIMLDTSILQFDHTWHFQFPLTAH